MGVDFQMHGYQPASAIYCGCWTILVMKGESIFLRQNFESETTSYSRAKSVADFFKISKVSVKNFFEILFGVFGITLIPIVELAFFLIFDTYGVY